MKSILTVVFLAVFSVSCAKEPSISESNVQIDIGVASEGSGTTQKFDHDAEYRIPNIPSVACGVYLPTRYIQALELSKSHQIAMQAVKGSPDGLYISANRVFGSGSYNDGYSFTSDSFKAFNLSRISEGLLYDEQNNEYRKIANFAKEYDDLDIKKFIIRKIFENIDANKLSDFQVKVVDTGIEFQGRVYEIQLNSIYEPKTLDQYKSEEDAIGIKVTKTGMDVYRLVAYENDGGYSVVNPPIETITF